MILCIQDVLNKTTIQLCSFLPIYKHHFLNCNLFNLRYSVHHIQHCDPLVLQIKD